MSTLHDLVGSDEPTTGDNLPADRALVDALYRQGAIDRSARQMALEMVYPREATRSIFLHCLLGIAATFLVFGIGLTTAANWQDLGRFLRLGIPQLVLVGCLAGTWWRGLESRSGKLLAAGVAVGIGACLIVLSQEFQLNADPPWLFGRWLLLAFPIVLVTRFQTLWLFWMALLNIYIFSLLEFGDWFNAWDDYFASPLVYPLFPCLLVLLVWEWLVATRQDRPGWEWIRPGWFRFVLLGWIYFLALGHILPLYEEFWESWVDGLDLLLLILEIGGIAVALWYFTTRSRDLWSLALTLLTVDIVLLYFLVRPLGESHDIELILLGGFVTTIAVFWGSFVYLARVRRQRRVATASPQQEGEEG